MAIKNEAFSDLNFYSLRFCEEKDQLAADKKEKHS